MSESLKEILERYVAKSYTRMPEDHDAYAAIGRVAAEWSYFERILDMTLWDLSGQISSKIACITAQLMGPSPRFRAIISLLRLRSKNLLTEDIAKENTDLISKYTALMNRIHDASEERNRLVHDAWYVDESGEPAQFRSMPWRNPAYGITPVDIESVAKTVAKIKNLTDQAQALRDRVMASLEASREIYPRPRPEAYRPWLPQAEKPKDS